MKFKILPLILAMACAALPIASCSRGAEEGKAATAETDSVYCEAETEHSESAATAEENSAEEQNESPAENSAEAENPTESPIGNSTDGVIGGAIENQIENSTEAAVILSAEEDEKTPSPNEGESEEEGENEEECESGEAEENESLNSAENAAEEEGQNSINAEAEQEEEGGQKTKQAENIVEKTSYIECVCTNLNIRSGAGMGYTSLGKAEKGTLFAYLGTENGWYKTYYKGAAAYLSANSSYTRVVDMERGSDSVESIISEGVKLIGTRYVYGAVRLHDGYGNLLSGFTAEEFDCSSLIQYIFYYGADVLLQVNTRTQVYQGQAVDRADLRRGDCIYFTNSSRYNNTGVERVGHVALYLGDGYILHTASDYCKIEKMNETRWGYYIEARRFV